MITKIAGSKRVARGEHQAIASLNQHGASLCAAHASRGAWRGAGAIAQTAITS